MNSSVVIAGALAQKPRHPGHTWQFLEYLLGFKRLGWDVLFLDQLEPEMCVDAGGQPCAVEQSFNLSFFMDVMNRFDLKDSFALLYNGGERCFGLSRQQVLERTRRSAFLLNFMGFLSDDEILACAPRRVFLDTDPGFPQMWKDLGLHDSFRGHHDYVTIAENIGQPGCQIPTCGLNWITTPQPVVLDCWPAQAAQGNGEWITSVASWRGVYGSLEYKGKTYGLRAHEFRKFAQLPRLSGKPFQLALDIHPAETNDLALLGNNGWSVLDPKRVTSDPWVYQSYIQGSKAEFMVAKNIYVQAKSGWFSDRSMCYLASGKPVVAQDTGIKHLYPTGEGLLTFTTMDEAISGIEEISYDYARHCRAARSIAEEYFDSDKVLTKLLSKLGVA